MTTGQDRLENASEEPIAQAGACQRCGFRQYHWRGRRRPIKRSKKEPPTPILSRERFQNPFGALFFFSVGTFAPFGVGVSFECSRYRFYVPDGCYRNFFARSSATSSGSSAR